MIVRPPHDARAVPVKWHRYLAVIMQQSNGDRTMIVRPPYDVSLFESAGVSVLCCIFVLHTFEVPSQLKMISCTRLLHEFLKVHEDHTSIVRSPHGLRTRAARASCDNRAIFMYGCRDSTMTARSPYDLRTFYLRLFIGLM